MKKTLVALAALAAVSAASAQSSVTLFGVVDAGYTNITTSNAGSVGFLSGNGRNASSRLGFRGVEDLGGGLQFGFWLEAGVNVDNGTGANTAVVNSALGDKILIGPGGASGSYPGAGSGLGGNQGLTFNRKSTMWVQGSWGRIELGRDYNPTFLNQTAFDPFGTVGVGSTVIVASGTLNPFAAGGLGGNPTTQVRASNSIQYAARVGDVYGVFMVGLSEIPSQCTAAGAQFNGIIQLANGTTGGASTTNVCLATDGDGELFAGRLGYAKGPLSVAIGYSQTKYSDTVINATTLTTLGGLNSTGVLAAAAGNQAPYRGTYTVANLVGTYDFGVAKVWGQINSSEVDINNVGSGNTQGGKLSSYLLAVTAPFGATEFKAAYNWGDYSRNGATPAPAGAWEDGSTSKMLTLGVVYNFSKRSAVYATVSNLEVTGQNTRANLGGLSSTAAQKPGDSNSTTGVDIGMRHSF